MSIWKILCCKGDEETKDNSSFIAHKQSIKAANLIQQACEFEKKDIYEGEQFQGKPHGNGSMIYANGDYYRGQWVKGIKQGRGLQVYNEEDSKYQGQWRNNMPNGHGKFIQKNGSYSVGEFQDGKKSGKIEFHDFQQKKTFVEVYDNGKLLDRKVIQMANQKEQQFPTLVLDKQRFNSLDLIRFQNANPEIKQFGLEFLLKYYGLVKIIHLDFIDTNINEWTIKQVLTFLAEIGLKEYQQIFYKNKIKGKDLLSLSQKEMKNDLNMKLGDRKRLANYIKYLGNIYTPKKEKKLLRRKKSPKNFIVPNQFFSKQLSSVQNPIKQESDEEWKDTDSPNYSTQKNAVVKERKEQRVRTNNFATQDWEKYHSNHQLKIHSYFEPESLRDRIESSEQKIASQDDQEKQIEKAELALRKISEDQNEQKYNKQTRDNKQNKQYAHLKESHAKDASKKSSSSSSSESCQVPPLVRGRSKNTQIRQLYQFLKQHTGLDFVIKAKDIQIQQQIGQGGYGKVYKGKYISCPVAVKDYLKPGRIHKSRDDFMKEVDVLSDLKHPSIVLYMGICITADKYQLITQYLENGSLFDQLHKKKRKFSKEQKLQFARDIVRGMVYLHNMKSMLHRDLKSSNVLLSEDWKVKLCDFGLSGKKKSKKKKNRVGTYQWMAPEVIRNEQIDFSSDVYSFGVVLWEILSEKVPYEGLSEAQIIGLVGYDENHKLDQVPEQADQFLVGMMQKCLNRDPLKRPTFMSLQQKFYQIEQQDRMKKSDSY